MNKKELDKVLNKYVENLGRDVFHKHKHYLIKPIKNSLLKGISFNLLSSGRVGVIFFIQPLYIPTKNIFLNFGAELKNQNNIKSWLLDENEQAFLLETISKVDFEIFNTIKTSTDFYNYFVINKEVGLRYKGGLVLALCKSNGGNSKNVLENLITYIDNSEGKSIPWVVDMKKNLDKLLNATQEEVRDILRDWEKETIDKLKLRI